MDFAKFLKESGLDSSLIGTWEESRLKEVKRYLKSVLKKLVGSKVHVGTASNQAIGNKAADWLIKELEQVSTARWKTQKTDVAAGYPDAFVITPSELIFLEIKASSAWSPTDSNRRVLLSKVERIRKLDNKYGKTKTKKHLLISIDYRKIGDDVQIEGFHIAFLQPKFQISKRVEASTSHRGIEALADDLKLEI